MTAIHADRNPSARWALAGLALSTLLPSLATSITNVGLPTLAQAFAASFAAVQWVVLAYLLVITTLIVSAGRLGDMLGRRRLLLAGILQFTIASLLCGFSPFLWLLILARAVQGLGAAIMLSLSMAFVGETVRKDQTGSAMGLLGSLSAAGTALGPTFGGLLIAGCGWPAIFLCNVPLGIVALVLAWRYLPADRRGPGVERSRFDSMGALLLAITLAAYALAMTTGHGSFGSVNLGLLTIAVLGAGLFVLVEMKAASPLIQLAMFRDAVLAGGFGMSSLVTTVVMATLVVGPFYLSGALGLDAARVGLVMSTGPIAAALAGVPAGRIVDRFGAHALTIAGLAGMAVACAFLALFATHFGVAAYVCPLLVLTVGYALFQAANNTAVITRVRPDQRGVVSGLLNLSRNLGLITGASVMGSVFALGSSAENVLAARPEAVAAGLRTTFELATVLIVIALAIAIAGRLAIRHDCKTALISRYSSMP